MTTEVWFRNPNAYVRELAEAGSLRVVWDRGFLRKNRIDPVKHGKLYFGTRPWRALAVGTQGSAEYGPDSASFLNPVAVYPTWAYGEDQGILEELIEYPVGNEPEYCTDTSLPADERPVYGQEHRVVITDMPNVNRGDVRRFLVLLQELQQEYPDCIIHLHGLYSYRVNFGMGFRSADVEARLTAQKGAVVLPTGSKVAFERVQADPKWARIVGIKPSDLSVPRNRCIFNILAAEWAGLHFNSDLNVRTIRGGPDPDVESPDSEATPVLKSGSPVSGGRPPGPGDKYVCNTCSLQLRCNYFRAGAVCTVPGAEPKPLAAFFSTRDSRDITDGLSILMAAGTRRLERTMREEDAIGEVNPEVNRLLGQLFDQGVKLAKLVDPNLRSGAKVQVNVGQVGSPTIESGSPRQLIAGAIRELENQGYQRSDITVEMIQELVRESSARRVIEMHPPSTPLEDNET